MGKVVFSLDVRADISAEEKANIQKYKLGETELYASHEISGGSGLLGSSSSEASLHTKAFMVDGETGFVGSFNLDPRSINLNT